MATQPVTDKDIDDQCIPEFEGAKSLRNPTYLPSAAFDQLSCDAAVKATIDQHFGSSSKKEKDRFIEYARQNPHIFLTLVSGSAVENIRLLRDARVKDCNLPVRKKIDGKTRECHIFSLKDPLNGANLRLDGFVERGDLGKTWTRTQLKSFVENQWQFYTVTFDKSRFLYEAIPEKCPLPFRQMRKEAPAGGGFGSIHRVGLRVEHLKPDYGHIQYLRLTPGPDNSEQVLEVAVKQLQRVDSAKDEEVGKFFDKEATALETMRALANPHLIQAIAAYTRGTERCFVFPWAPNGSLHDMWKGNSNYASQEVRQWAWDQILGLTGALAKLHDKNTRHGDMKPANILRFNSSGSKLGPLVIADVGIAKYHAFETAIRQENEEPTTNRARTPRYEPPEIDFPEEDYEGKVRVISRRYDSWSLGCVLLEFIAWLKDGRTGLKTLEEKRRAKSKSGINRYWELGRDDRPILNPGVNQYIGDLLQDPTLPEALADLLKLLEEHLLVASLRDRSKVAIFLGKLEEVSKNCSNTPSYLWDDTKETLTERRGPTAEIVDTGLFPISQKRTSKLVDKWEVVKDVSCQRELLAGSTAQWHTSHQLENYSKRVGSTCQVLRLVSEANEFQRSLQDLCDSASECDLCTFICRRLSALNIELKQPLRLARVQSSIRVYPVDRPIVSLYCDPASGPVASSLPFAQFGLPIIPEPGSSEEFELLKTFVHHCDQRHDCLRPRQDCMSAPDLPTRLIDVGASSQGPIRLIQTNQKIQDRYIALSHCWGRMNDDQRFCTYESNIDQRMADIPYDRLPATFRDAINVTRALGVRYLWIDSLCIIQKNAQDWLKESARMENVFSNAYCTIAASSASSSLVGFLGPRKPRDAISVMASSGPVFLAEYIDDFASDVENSVLNSRGWVFQERALSRRTIYFTSKQVYWECGDGIICETLAMLRNPQSHFLGDSNFPYFALQFYKDERIRLLQHFYTTYSSLALTKASDYPHAIAGLQKRIVRVFKSNVDFGIFWRWPARTLLWCSAQPGSLASIRYDDDGAKPPSWSWMAYSGRIAYLDIDFGGVEWTEYGRGPPDGPDWALHVKARELRVDGAVLKERAVLDTESPEALHDSWRCVVLGKENMGRGGSDDTYYVLLIRPVTRHSLSLPSDQLEEYHERVGVATLLGSHLLAEEKPVFLV